MALAFNACIKETLLNELLTATFINSSNRKAVGSKVHTQLGASVIVKGGIIDCPKGTKTHPNIFENKCLLVSVLLGILKHLNPLSFQDIKPLFYKRTSLKNKDKAVQILNDALLSMCQMCQFNLQGPHVLEDILPKIVDVFNIQVRVIKSMEGSYTNIVAFPEQPSYEKPRIYLYLISNLHVVLIDNLQAFFRYHKKIVCFDCKRFFALYRRLNHRCQKQSTCFNCDGIFQTENTFLQDNEIIKFCDSNLITNQIEEFICSNCNLTFKSHLCYANHNLKCEQNCKGWKCLQCGIYQTVSSKEMCEQLQKEHQCGEIKRRCEFCYVPKENNHICKIKAKLPHTVWPNLGFLAMKFRNTSNGNCQNCYYKRKQYVDVNNITFAQLFKDKIYKELVCDNHKNLIVELEPNLICLMYEFERFHFKEKLFIDDALPLVNVLEKDFQFTYSSVPKPMTFESLKKKRCSQKVTPSFDRNLKKQFDTSYKPALSKFALFLCNGNFKNYTFVVSCNNTMLAILQTFLKLGIVPEYSIQHGYAINYLEISCLQIRFIYVGCYLKGSVYEMAKQYNVKHKEIYFPNCWNVPEKYGYEGKIPNLSDFYSYSDTLTERNAKIEFYKTLLGSWNMSHALAECLQNETFVFAQSVLSFLYQSLELQILIKQISGKEVGEIHPFGWRVTSLSSFTYSIFSLFYMNYCDIYTVMNPYTGGKTFTSQGEYEWLTWLNWKNYNLNIKHAFNTFEGQVRFGKRHVDGYSAVNKTVYQYQGCEFHYHDPKECTDSKNKLRTLNSTNCHNKTLSELKITHDLEKELLTKHFPYHIKNIEYQYACHWKDFKKLHPTEIETMWMSCNLQVNRPLIRLVPRATLRGGFIEQYRLKFTKTDFPNWSIHFADVNSLYSHIAIHNSLPVGKYKILLQEDNFQNDITFLNGEFWYKGQSMQGDAAQVTIIPPTSLDKPFLGYRLNDEYNYYALCKKCVIEKRAGHCTHVKASQRAFTSCYQVTDLAKAVSLGYEISDWYELHHYDQREPILKEFVQILGVQKIKNSNIFDTKLDLNTVSENINKKMSLPTSLKIENKIYPSNSAQKQLFKDMMNSFFGRFALHSNFTHHYFCRNLFELQKLACKENCEVVDIMPISDDICEIEIIEPTKIKPNTDGCLYITSEINALARKFIYEQMELIESVKGIIIGVDTDAIVYALPPGVSDVLTYSDAFGDFKKVLGLSSEITSFYSLGPRNYSITYFDSDGVEKHLIKVKGLCTTSINNSHMLSENTYSNFLEKRFQDEFNNIYLPQMRQKFNKQKKQFYEILTHFEFGNEIHTKRYVSNNDNFYLTHPYGYKFLNIAKITKPNKQKTKSTI